MKAPDRYADGGAAGLRRAFDDAFARPPGSDVERGEDLLEISLGTTTYMLRTSEVAGLFMDKVITPLPTPLPELLGLVSVRRTLLPIYDLSALLSYPSQAAPRCLVVAAAAAVAFAFVRFERHVRVAPDAVASHGLGDTNRRLPQVVRIGDETRPLVSLTSVIESVAGRARLWVTNREQEAEHG